MIKEKNFRECRLSWLERTFGLDQMDILPSLKDWLSAKEEILDFDSHYLLRLQEHLTFNVRDWYEKELDSFSSVP